MAGAACLRTCSWESWLSLLMSIRQPVSRAASLPCHLLERDDAVHELGHLELEQLLDEIGVGAGADDLRPPRRATNLHDVGLHPRAVVVALPRHLLRLRQECLDALAEVEQD